MRGVGVVFCPVCGSMDWENHDVFLTVQAPPDTVCEVPHPDDGLNGHTEDGKRRHQVSSHVQKERWWDTDRLEAPARTRMLRRLSTHSVAHRPCASASVGRAWSTRV
jgi:hypothetical protein